MGKAAKNERLKLRATFCNNVAVGLLVAGGALPYFAVISRALSTTLEGGWSYRFTPSEWNGLMLPAIVAAACIIASSALHSHALKIADQLED